MVRSNTGIGNDDVGFAKILLDLLERRFDHSWFLDFRFVCLADYLVFRGNSSGGIFSILRRAA